MKALYPTVSYTLFIVISVAALSVLLISVRGFAEQSQERYAKGQLECAADIVRNDIMSMYVSESSGLSKTELPTYITGKKYIVEAQNKTVTLTMDIMGRTVSVVRTLDINISLSGREYAPVFLDYQKDERVLVIR